MGMNKDKLVFDPTDITAASGNDDVGAYVRGSDGTLITKTTIAAKNGLDVNVINPLTVTTGSEKAEDAAHTSGDIGSYVLAVRQDTLASSTSADGDYASLKVNNVGSLYTSDTGVQASIDSVIKTDNSAFTDGTSKGLAVMGVDATNTYQPFKLNAAGELLVAADISVVTGSDKAEDAVHATGDIGTYILSVREDTPTSSTSATGDYQSIKTDALGRTWINNTNNTAVFSAVAVATTATDLVATDLVNRKRILVQNVATKNVFIGLTGVTATTGLRLGAGSSIELDVAAGVNLFGITTGVGTADVRILELS